MVGTKRDTDGGERVEAKGRAAGAGAGVGAEPRRLTMLRAGGRLVAVGLTRGMARKEPAR